MFVLIYTSFNLAGTGYFFHREGDTMRNQSFIQKILLVIFVFFCFQTGGSTLFLSLSQAGEPETLTLSQASGQGP